MLEDQSKGMPVIQYKLERQQLKLEIIYKVCASRLRGSSEFVESTQSEEFLGLGRNNSVTKSLPCSLQF